MYGIQSYGYGYGYGSGHHDVDISLTANHAKSAINEKWTDYTYPGRSKAVELLKAAPGTREQIRNYLRNLRYLVIKDYVSGTSAFRSKAFPNLDMIGDHEVPGLAGSYANPTSILSVLKGERQAFCPSAQRCEHNPAAAAMDAMIASYKAKYVNPFEGKSRAPTRLEPESYIWDARAADAQKEYVASLRKAAQGSSRRSSSSSRSQPSADVVLERQQTALDSAQWSVGQRFMGKGRPIYKKPVVWAGAVVGLLGLILWKIR